jgi:cell division control protein 6
MRPGKPQRISLLGIVRDLKLLDKLDASARSTLQRNLIELEKYSEPQLLDILNDRVAIAFEASAVPEDTVSLVAELARSESGNARFAIELLWRAGKYTDAENAGEVLPEYVRKAVSSIFPMMKKTELSSLGLHEKLFLLGVARFFKESEKAYASLNDVEKSYAIACEEYGEVANSHTMVWKYSLLLSDLGFVKAEVASIATRGRSTRISLPSIPAGELEKELSAMLE